ncbi:MAG TPA: CoA transferase [Candidatus Latescibacteria bacterium]|nr:CoA transferase [Candidatus Latescibacterota bacterium]
MPHKPASPALKKYTVLDLTRVRAGPTCVRQLADWGANVIKIEIPDTLAGSNQMGGSREGSDFQNLHRNKRSLSLNLKDEEGRKIFLELAQTADVVVENFRPDVKFRLGIDYETLSKDNPGLIYASISGFGQDGPYADRPGFDQVAQGVGGLMSITGLPGQGPVRVGIPVADLTAGIFGAQGILVALLEREQSGKGQWIQTSLLQAQIFMLDFQSARWLVDGEVPAQAGNNHPTTIPTGVFKTSDGEINISVAGEIIWQRFCDEIGRNDLFDHPDYNTGEKRSDNRDALNALIEESICLNTTAHWVGAFNLAGVPCGPINTIDQTFSDPQVKHLKMTKKVDSKALGTLEFVGQPMTLNRTPSSFALASPECGEHTEEILESLGYSTSEIAELRGNNIV